MGAGGRSYPHRDVISAARAKKSRYLARVNLLPISGSAFDRLGKRLADGGVTGLDLDQFTEIRLAYGQALEKVQAGLSAIGLPATGRVKTSGTLVEKLRRTPGLTIRGVHDLAGCRVVLRSTQFPAGTTINGQTLQRDHEVSDGRFLQDHILKTVLQAFDEQHEHVSRAPKVLDRRENPSAGYRAVHAVAFIRGLPVEIQIRTQLQHRWAEAAERLGDSWGRGLRYGSGPNNPQQEVVEGQTRQDVVQALAKVADGVARYEELQAKVDDLDVELASMALDPLLEAAVRQAVDVRGEIYKAKETTESMLRVVTDLVERVG
jgi:ppGpp synthetase/RelA/SpoT-type nucleotidyltranferase